MGRVDCGGDNNWDNCDALEIEKGTNGFYRTTPRFPLPHSLLAARLVLDVKEDPTQWAVDIAILSV